MTSVQPARPQLQYEGRTPFVAYTEADVLHGLIHTNTDEPLEANFVIVTQIMELHFELLRREWQLAIARLPAGERARYRRRRALAAAALRPELHAHGDDDP